MSIPAVRRSDMDYSPGYQRIHIVKVHPEPSIRYHSKIYPTLNEALLDTGLPKLSGDVFILGPYKLFSGEGDPVTRMDEVLVNRALETMDRDRFGSLRGVPYPMKYVYDRSLLRRYDPEYKQHHYCIAVQYTHEYGPVYLTAAKFGTEEESLTHLKAGLRYHTIDDGPVYCAAVNYGTVRNKDGAWDYALHDAVHGLGCWSTENCMSVK